MPKKSPIVARPFLHIALRATLFYLQNDYLSLIALSSGRLKAMDFGLWSENRDTGNCPVGRERDLTLVLYAVWKKKKGGMLSESHASLCSLDF